MTRLDRDALTWLTYAQLGTYGYFLYGFGPSLSLLRDEQQVSRTIAGLHGTALATGALVAALVTRALVARFGRALVIWSGLVGLCLGAVSYTGSTMLVFTLFGAFLSSFGGSFVVTLSAVVLLDRHAGSGAAAVSEANAISAGLGMLAPLAIGALVVLGLGWRPAMLLVLPSVLAMAVLARRLATTRGTPSTTRPEAPAGRLSRRYWISWAVVTAGIAVEFCLTLWTADLLRDRVGLSPGAAAAAVTALVAGMCIGRAGGGRLSLRVPLDLLLYGAIATTAVGFAMLWLTAAAWVAVIALVVCGLGVALFYPLGIARAIGASEGRPDHASARTGLGAALASGGGPFALGALADQVGIHNAMLIVPGLLVVAAVGLYAAPHRAAPAPATAP